MALRLDPAHADAYNERGDAHCGLGEFGRAVDDFDAAIQIDPAHADARCGLAIIHTYLGDDAGATREVDVARALGVDPSSLRAVIEEARQARESTGEIAWTGDGSFRWYTRPPPN